MVGRTCAVRTLRRGRPGSLGPALVFLSFTLLSSFGIRNESKAHEPGTERKVLKIAAASDLQFALNEIISHFKSAELSVTYGSSGNLAAQFMQKAPFDLFLSADSSYSKKLVEEGLALSKDEFFYAVGRIGLWMPNTSTIDMSKGMAILLDSAVRKIAIANPAHAPYGKAAIAALKSARVAGVPDLYEAVKNKLVFAENIGQAAQFVQSGAAQVGILAMGLIMAPQMKQTGKYWIVPQSTYPRMDQAGVILKATKDRQEADEFKEFLLSPEAQTILESYGFSPPPAAK